MESGSYTHNYKCKDPLLDLILQKYIQASRDTLRGPVAIKADLNLFSKHNVDKEYNKPEIPEESKLRPTNLDGFNISSFSVGGEKRLAFTELVRTVLKDINVRDIFKKRDNLLIFTSKCTQKQLEELKYRGVLPWTSTSSNLITKSDAYRLCGALQGHLALKCDVKLSHASFEVYHECFGGCIGTFDPEIYIEPKSACIKCAECKGLFSPTKFVSHNHTSYDEVHTCHWGFDSSRWKIYLMLVEQKACTELLNLWKNIKQKFTLNQSHLKGNKFDQDQDAEFVAFIHSPDHKKAVASPIEVLRSQEENSKYKGIDKKDNSSAFRPWSPNPTRPLSSKRMDNVNNSECFRYPSNSIDSFNSSNFNNSSTINKHRSTCGCGPAAPHYMNCSQCRNAAQSSCSSLHILAQKASERPCEGISKGHFDSNVSPKNCLCEECSQQNSNALESSVEDIIKNFTSKDMKLTTSTKDLARLLSSAIKHLHISQEEKVREMSVSNQRLQTELHLVKLESHKKLSEARDTKAHVEQELETLHREREKEITLFNQMRWELGHKGANCDPKEIERLQTEIAQLKAHLEQSAIDRENLKKQLNWHSVSKKNSISDNWTPYPSIARKFSDSSDDNISQGSQQVSVVSKSDTHQLEREESIGPEPKVIKLDLNKEEDSSDIEVED